jgi:hypothetical protein
MSLYSILNNENYITHCEEHDECPINGTPLLNTEFIRPRLVNGVLIEGEITSDILTSLRNQAINIDLDYTKRISELMAKHNDKFIEGIITGIPYTIPNDVLVERERLKDECNSLILSLGINDFTYRQNILQLKK